MADPFVVASLAAYAARIDATQINFKRYMVRRYFGNYYTERVLITLESDGTIRVTDDEYAPTKEEAEAIAREVAKTTFPHSIKVSSIADLMPRMKSSTFYEFRDPDDGDLIVMVQERREQEDGGKYFVPWTKFSDGEWRSMEPDGRLPFWRPSLSPRERRVRVMLHEGVKAAMAANRIVREEEAHPWLGELSLYEHWGAIGGALAPQRLDYAALKRKKPAEVIYVCDNDFVGRQALVRVSEAYRDPLRGIMFDERWPEAWDIADQMPENFWSRNGRYVGPMLRDLAQPATWAITWRPPKTARHRPTIELNINFQQEWAHSVVPEAYVHRDFPDRVLSAREFDNAMAPYAGANKINLSQMMKTCGANKVEELGYEPDLEPGFYNLTGRRFFNTHVGSSIKANGAVSHRPFLEFMQNMIPDNIDRTEVLRWVATLIARPGVRMRYGLLMIGEHQGVGKSTLGESILAPLVGRHNYSPPSEHTVVESSFNYWAARKRLVVVHEIYSGHSFKAYNKLKSMITERDVEVNQKFLAPHTLTNWCHMYLCSNHSQALKLDNDDRRWLVPKITEQDQSEAYWVNFHRWLSEQDGLSAIRAWADDFLESHLPVSPAANAPTTTIKREMILDGYSEEQLFIREFIQKIKDRAVTKRDWLAEATRPRNANGDWQPRGVVLMDSQLIEAMRSVRDIRAEYKIRPHGVRKIAKSEGLAVMDRSIYCSDWTGCTTHTRLMFSEPDLVRADNERIRSWVRPIDVVAIVHELMGRSPM
jgi:hypothetical protein